VSEARCHAVGTHSGAPRFSPQQTEEYDDQPFNSCCRPRRWHHGRSAGGGAGENAGASITAPSGPVDLNVNVGSKSMPTDAWIGRPVYSIDSKNIGEVAAIMGDQVYADIGGFLGLGETRVLLSLEQIASVKADRIDLTITEAEADKLPDVDATRSRKR
jgi:hypothetical protein